MDESRKAPPRDASLELEHAYGYHCAGVVPTSDRNAHFLEGRRADGVASATRDVVFSTAALVVIQEVPSQQDIAAGIAFGNQRFFDLHDDDVSALTTHPDGRHVASGQIGKEAIIYVWDSAAAFEPGTKLLSPAALLATLQGHKRRIVCLDFSHDGKLLVSVGEEDKAAVRVWNWKDAAQLCVVSGAVGPVSQMRFNPFQSYGIPDDEPRPGQAAHPYGACYCLASVGRAGMRVWTLRGTEDGNWSLNGARASFQGSSQQNQLPDFTSLTFIDDSEPLSIMAEESGVEIKQIPGSSNRTHSRIVAGSVTGGLFVFIQPGVGATDPTSFDFDTPWWLQEAHQEVGAGNRAWACQALLQDVLPATVSEGNQHFMSEKANAKLKSMEERIQRGVGLHPAERDRLNQQLAKSNFQGPITSHQGAVISLAYCRCSGKLLSTCTGGTIRLWDCHGEGGDDGWPVLNPMRNCPQSISELNVKYTKNGTRVNFPPGTCIRTLVLSADGMRLLVGTSNNTLMEGSLSAREFCSLARAHVHRIVSIDTFPHTPEFVSVSRERRGLMAWHMDAKTMVAEADLPAAPSCVSVSSNGNLIAVAMHSTNEIALYNTVRNDVDGVISSLLPLGLHPIEGSADNQESMPAASVSTSRRRTSRLREARELSKTSDVGSEKPVAAAAAAAVVGNGDEETTTKGLSGSGCTALAFSKSGKMLAVGTRDASIAVMDVDEDGNLSLRGNVRGHSAAILHLDWSDDDQWLQSDAKDSQLLHWEVPPLPDVLSALRGDDGKVHKAYRPKLYRHPFLLRDTQWNQQSCILGWSMQGIVPPHYSSTADLNSVHALVEKGVIASGDNFKVVRLLNYPVLPGAEALEYYGHSSYISVVRFSKHDPQNVVLLSAGALDGVVLQWKFHHPGEKASPSLLESGATSGESHLTQLGRHANRTKRRSSLPEISALSGIVGYVDNGWTEDREDAEEAFYGGYVQHDEAVASGQGELEQDRRPSSVGLHNEILQEETDSDEDSLQSAHAACDAPAQLQLEDTAKLQEEGAMSPREHVADPSQKFPDDESQDRIADDFDAENNLGNATSQRMEPEDIALAASTSQRIEHPLAREKLKQQDPVREAMDEAEQTTKRADSAASSHDGTDVDASDPAGTAEEDGKRTEGGGTKPTSVGVSDERHHSEAELLPPSSAGDDATSNTEGGVQLAGQGQADAGEDAVSNEGLNSEAELLPPSTDGDDDASSTGGDVQLLAGQMQADAGEDAALSDKQDHGAGGSNPQTAD